MSVEKYRSEARRWLLQAEADIKAAVASNQAGTFEWACFQAQQAGEKALKALWLYHAHEPWGHSLVKLVQDFPNEACRDGILSLLPQAKRLDKLYIPTRYPNGLPDSIPAEVFSSEDATDAIDTARDVISYIKKLMGS